MDKEINLSWKKGNYEDHWMNDWLLWEPEIEEFQKRLATLLDFYPDNNPGFTNYMGRGGTPAIHIKQKFGWPHISSYRVPENLAEQLDKEIEDLKHILSHTCERCGAKDAERYIYNNWTYCICPVCATELNGGVIPEELNLEKGET